MILLKKYCKIVSISISHFDSRSEKRRITQICFDWFHNSKMKRWKKWLHPSYIGMTRLLLFQKIECNGGPIFKVVLECWTFSYLYLWPTMWFHAEKLLKTLKFWKSLNSLCKSGSRPQKSPKKPRKRITQSRFTQIFE